MSKITLHDKTFKKAIPYEELSKAIDKVADNINADFAGCEDIPVLLCVLNGSIMFMGELMQRLNFNCQVVSIKLTSYEGTNTTGRVKQAMGLTADITGRRVIVVEDIVDSGMTLSFLKRILLDRGAASLRIATLLDKPARRRVELEVDYSCFEIPDAFVVGYGLDYNETYRNLPDIGVLSPRIYADK